MVFCCHHVDLFNIINLRQKWKDMKCHVIISLMLYKAKKNHKSMITLMDVPSFGIFASFFLKKGHKKYINNFCKVCKFIRGEYTTKSNKKYSIYCQLTQWHLRHLAWRFRTHLNSLKNVNSLLCWMSSLFGGKKQLVVERNTIILINKWKRQSRGMNSKSLFVYKLEWTSMINYF